MPSETRVQEALAAFAPARAAHRERLAATAGEVRAWLDSRGATAEERSLLLARELGPFATGRIDARRLAGLLPRPAPLQGEARELVARALEILEGSVAEAGEGLPLALPPGGDLRDAVRGALDRWGRAFGAARAVELARSGRWSREQHGELLEAHPFRRWSEAERAAVPPLVVTLGGEDLHPAGLAELLLGHVRVALVVEGAAPPAALARLVSPGVWVAQSPSADALALLSSVSGPGVLALFDAARAPEVVSFVHDPAAGSHAWERIALSGEPDALLERARTGDRRWRREGSLEDLAHLLSLAVPPATQPVAPVDLAETAAEDPAGRLAAWLLAGTDLSGT